MANSAAAKNLENKVEKCAAPLGEGLNWLKNAPDVEKADKLRAQIFAQKASLACWQGDVHFSVILKEYNGAATYSALQNRKSLILNEIGQAKAFYEQTKRWAAEAQKMGPTEKTEQFSVLLAERDKTLKMVESELKK